VSFILDALRKSEHARQRQTGPGLAEVPVAAPRTKTNVWATAAVALLVVNLLAVGVLLLRRAQQQDSTAAAATVASGNAPAAAPAAAGPGAPNAVNAANPTLVASPPVAAQTPAITQSAQPPSRRPAMNDVPSRNPLADEVGAADGGYEPSVQAAAASVPTGPPAVVSNAAGTKRGSVVYEPVPEAADAPYAAAPAAPAVQPAAATPPETLPGADELTARGNLPALHLDLHVYATQVQQRFIFVNSRKYREGETLAEGPVVEQITADGAVLNFRGSRFKLAND
jgi:general secretion pathway protein B